MTVKELIEYALDTPAIIEKIANTSYNSSTHYLALYEGENSIAVSHVQKGWDTRTALVAFGSKKISKKKVIQMLQEELVAYTRYEQYIDERN